MKLTWFGATALRVHIGGQVVVIDADAAPAVVDGPELVSGADLLLTLDSSDRHVDGRTWKPRPAQRLLDAGDAVRPVDTWTLGSRAALIDPDEDMPLVVLGGELPPLGRWVERAVVLMAGPDLAQRLADLLDATRPRLIALAGDDAEVDAAVTAMRDRLDGTGLVALEPGLAVEV